MDANKLQRVRTLLVLLQAKGNGRAVSEERLEEEAAREGVRASETSAALRILERQGLAHKTRHGWLTRLRVPASGVGETRMNNVRLHPH